MGRKVLPAPPSSPPLVYLPSVWRANGPLEISLYHLQSFHSSQLATYYPEGHGSGMRRSTDRPIDRSEILDFFSCFFLLQRMPQLLGPDQGARLGRGQRPQVEAPAEVDARERRLPRPDDHRGADAVRRDGRLVQPGEAVRQVLRVREHTTADQRRDQGRGEGTDLCGL